METDRANGSKESKESVVRCGDCRHFSFFFNEKGHNSPQALGKCLATPWDGNRGQWPMLLHPCPHFSSKSD